MEVNFKREANRKQKAVLKTIAEAFQLSAHVLLLDPAQLTSQMVGRLLNLKNTSLQEVVLEGIAKKQAVWFRSLSPTLTSPGGPLVRTIELPEGVRFGLSVSPNGKRCAVAIGDLEDHTVKVWDLDSGKELYALTGHANWVKALALSLDGKLELTSTWDGPLELWNIETGKLLHKLEGHTSLASPVAMSADGTRAVSVQKGMRVWNLQTGELLYILEGYSAKVRTLEITNDGRKAISVHADKTLRIWNLDSGTLEHILTGHKANIYIVRITQDGKKAISTSKDKTLRIWDMETGALLCTYDADGIYKIRAITPDGTRGISTVDSPFKLWSLENGEVIKTFKVENNFSVRAEIDAAGSRAITLSLSTRSTLNVWDLESDGESIRLSKHNSSVQALAITSDGKQVISGDVRGSINVWDLNTHQVIRSITGNKETINALAIVPNNKGLIVCSYETPLAMWDLERGELLQASDRSASRIALSPDGKKVFSYSGKTIHVWNLEKNKPLPPLRNHISTITSMTVTMDGTKIVYGTGEGGLTEYGDVQVWDLIKNENRGKLGEHTANVNSVVVSPDDKYAVSGSGDRTIKVWSLDERRLLKTLYGHQRRITSLALTPDGCTILSASLDKTARLWDLDTGAELAVFTMEDPIKVCAISPDGLTVITGDEEGKVHFLRLENLAIGPLILTAKDYGKGLTLFCPACGNTSRIRKKVLGSVITCPQPDCDRLLKINPFITNMKNFR